MQILLQELILNTKMKRNHSSKNFSCVFSAQTMALSGVSVSVETDISRGLHSFSIIGLPDKAVEEARDRVGAAIKHAGFKSPKQQNQKIVISLAPASLKKNGALFDLPIALSYLSANGDIAFEVQNKMFIGELSLKGEVKKGEGVLSLIRHAREAEFEEVYFPAENIEEAKLIKGIKLYPVSNLPELISHLKGEAFIAPVSPYQKLTFKYPKNNIEVDDIKGQHSAKRAIGIAAAGGHNIALYGPPGTGKTLMAKAMQSLLPPLNSESIIDTTSLHSLAGILGKEPITYPPCRSPHHSASPTSIIGGGVPIRPGEISLAHNGILFLDEFPEFDRRIIEALREPLEEGSITIARAYGSEKFPADCILVVAMNPCPCGNYGSEERCVCPPSSIERYRRKLSGPIIDRIDMWVCVNKIDIDVLQEKSQNRNEGENMRQKIRKARERQEERYKNYKFSKNANISVKEIDDLIPLKDNVKEIFKKAQKTIGLSPRAYHRVVKCARTIADLEGEEEIKEEIALEAIQYRQIPY